MILTQEQYQLYCQLRAKQLETSVTDGHHNDCTDKQTLSRALRYGDDAATELGKNPEALGKVCLSGADECKLEFRDDLGSKKKCEEREQQCTYDTTSDEVLKRFPVLDQTSGCADDQCRQRQPDSQIPTQIPHKDAERKSGNGTREGLEINRPMSISASKNAHCVEQLSRHKENLPSAAKYEDPDCIFFEKNRRLNQIKTQQTPQFDGDVKDSVEQKFKERPEVAVTLSTNDALQECHERHPMRKSTVSDQETASIHPTKQHGAVRPRHGRVVLKTWSSKRVRGDATLFPDQPSLHLPHPHRYSQVPCRNLFRDITSEILAGNGAAVSGLARHDPWHDGQRRRAHDGAYEWTLSDASDPAFSLPKIKVAEPLDRERSMLAGAVNGDKRAMSGTFLRPLNVQKVEDLLHFSTPKQRKEMLALPYSMCFGPLIAAKTCPQPMNSGVGRQLVPISSTKPVTRRTVGNGAAHKSHDDAFRVLDTITVGACPRIKASPAVGKTGGDSTAELQQQAGSAFLTHPTLMLKTKNRIPSTLSVGDLAVNPTDVGTSLSWRLARVHPKRVSDNRNHSSNKNQVSPGSERDPQQACQGRKPAGVTPDGRGQVESTLAASCMHDHEPSDPQEKSAGAVATCYVEDNCSDDGDHFSLPSSLTSHTSLASSTDSEINPTTSSDGPGPSAAVPVHHCSAASGHVTHILDQCSQFRPNQLGKPEASEDGDDSSLDMSSSVSILTSSSSSRPSSSSSSSVSTAETLSQIVGRQSMQWRLDKGHGSNHADNDNIPPKRPVSSRNPSPFETDPAKIKEEISLALQRTKSPSPHRDPLDAVWSALKTDIDRIQSPPCLVKGVAEEETKADTRGSKRARKQETVTLKDSTNAIKQTSDATTHQQKTIEKTRPLKSVDRTQEGGKESSERKRLGTIKTNKTTDGALHRERSQGKKRQFTEHEKTNSGPALNPHRLTSSHVRQPVVKDSSPTPADTSPSLHVERRQKELRDKRNATVLRMSKISLRDSPSTETSTDSIERAPFRPVLRPRSAFSPGSAFSPKLLSPVEKKRDLYIRLHSSFSQRSSARLSASPETTYPLQLAVAGKDQKRIETTGRTAEGTDQVELDHHLDCTSAQGKPLPSQPALKLDTASQETRSAQKLPPESMCPVPESMFLSRKITLKSPASRCSRTGEFARQRFTQSPSGSGEVKEKNVQQSNTNNEVNASSHNDVSNNYAKKQSVRRKKNTVTDFCGWDCSQGVDLLTDWEFYGPNVREEYLHHIKGEDETCMEHQGKWGDPCAAKDNNGVVHENLCLSRHQVDGDRGVCEKVHSRKQQTFATSMSLLRKSNSEMTKKALDDSSAKQYTTKHKTQNIPQSITKKIHGKTHGEKTDSKSRLQPEKNSEQGERTSDAHVPKLCLNRRRKLSTHNNSNNNNVTVAPRHEQQETPLHQTDQDHQSRDPLCRQAACTYTLLQKKWSHSLRVLKKQENVQNGTMSEQNERLIPHKEQSKRPRDFSEQDNHPNTRFRRHAELTEKTPRLPSSVRVVSPASKPQEARQLVTGQKDASVKQSSTSLQLDFSVLRTTSGDSWLDLFQHRS